MGPSGVEDEESVAPRPARPVDDTVGGAAIGRLLQLIAGILTGTGGIMSHAACLGEYGFPGRARSAGLEHLVYLGLGDLRL